MALTFTAGPAGAAVKGCLSGALNCVRAEEGAELVTVSAYKCGGGRVEGTPEDPTKRSLSIGAHDKNRDLEAV